MRIFDFVPISDHPLNGDSLIENVFAPGFCIVDEAGRLLSTAHNQNLLRRARLLVESMATVDSTSVQDGLAALRAKADTLTQGEYELAVRRELLEAAMDRAEDYSRLAGSLA